MSSICEIFKQYHKKITPLDLELILENVLKKPRPFILAHPEYKIPKFKILNLKFKINRRLGGEPLAYILGQKEFYGLDFKVNKNVLVPRPETEMMVEEALNRISHIAYRATQKKITIVDVGTGSGCIIITLAKIINPRLPGELAGRQNLKFIATDISKRALNVARQNARQHSVAQKIKFFHGDLLKPVLKSKILNLKSKIIILANLPYLTPAQIKKSPSIKYEPKLALSAGRDGLKYYRRLFKQIKIFINLQKFVLNSNIFVIAEIDPSQTKKIKRLVKKELPRFKSQIKKDLQDLNRLVIAKISSPKRI